LVPALKKGDIYRGGGREIFESYKLYKNTKTVMDKDEERRTIQEIYKDSIANFAFIHLGMSHSIYIK
jgi:hypothetical protein